MSPRKLELIAHHIIHDFLALIGHHQHNITIEVRNLNNDLAQITTNWPYNDAHITITPQPTTTLTTTLLHECCHLLLAPLAEGGDKEELVASSLATAFARLLPDGWWKPAVRRATRYYKEEAARQKRKEARVIKKTKDGWRVLSSKGKNLGGPYKTKKEAEQRLRQVEHFKHSK